MKNILRAFALSLVVTGLVASTHIAKASQPSVGSRIADIPVPMCPPGDPSGCGICQFSGACPATN